MTTKPLPTVGAAMPISALETYREWLIAGQRDLEIQDPFAPEVLDGNWQPLLQQARTLLDGFTGRLGIHGPFMSLTLLARDPKIRTVVTDRLRQGVEFAQALGGTHMVVHSPFDYFGSPFLPHSPGHGQAQQFEIIHATLDPVVALAAQANVTLVIEDIYDKNSAPLLALIRSFNSPNVRLSIDVGHAFIKHVEGGPTPDQWVREGGDLLEHVHLQDTDGNIDRHWMPGVGRLNWFALFEALATLAHQPRLLLELRNKEEIGKATQWLAAQGLAQ